MAKLEGQSIAASYDQLLHVDRDGGGNTTTLVGVKDGDNDTTFCLQLSTTKAMIEGNGSTLYFYDEGGEYISADNGGELTIAAGTALNITAGTVGIGTSSPANESSGTLLHIADTGSSSAAHLNFSGGDGADGSQTGKISFSDPSDTDDAVAFISANIEGGTTNPGGNLHFFTSTTGSGEGDNTVAEKMVISGAGDVTVSAGDLIMGTSGKGISFAATSDASGMSSEVLDDYEEGTWTPQDTDAGGSSQYGLYTKIGNLVTCSFQFQTGAISGSDTFYIKNLPFTVGATNAFRGPVTIGYTNATNMPLGGRANEGATTAYLMIGTDDIATDDEIGSSKTLTGAIIYRV